MIVFLPAPVGYTGYARVGLADDTVEVTVGGGDGTVTIYKRDRRGFIDDAAVTLEGQVMSLSKSADGAEILAGTKSGFVYRLRTQGLAALLLAETHSASVTAVAYAPNVSEKFVTASADGTLRIWDASDYTVSVKCFVGDGGAPTCVALFLDAMISGWTDGKFAATAQRMVSGSAHTECSPWRGNLISLELQPTFRYIWR